MHTYEQFLQVSVALGLGLVFVHLFSSSFCVFWFSLDYFVLELFANRLAGKNVSEMTYFELSGT